MAHCYDENDDYSKAIAVQVYLSLRHAFSDDADSNTEISNLSQPENLSLRMKETARFLQTTEENEGLLEKDSHPYNEIWTTVKQSENKDFSIEAAAFEALSEKSACRRCYHFHKTASPKNCLALEECGH